MASKKVLGLGIEQPERKILVASVNELRNPERRREVFESPTAHFLTQLAGS
jgi:hypothetical protein